MESLEFIAADASTNEAEYQILFLVLHLSHDDGVICN